MKVTLSTYIKQLEAIRDAHGDLPMFTADDSEGNSYTENEYGPQVRYLSPEEDQHRPDNLIPERGSNETVEAWCDDHLIEEEDIPTLKKVVLL